MRWYKRFDINGVNRKLRCLEGVR